jgi:hypothetical protein
MATALQALRRLQLGKETTAGTVVPATVAIPAMWEQDEQVSAGKLKSVTGYRIAPANGPIVSRAFGLKVDTELTAEEILWPLLTGLANVTPSGSGPAYTWTFSPALGGHANVATATAECVKTDGATNHYVAIVPYCFTQKFSIEWNASDIAALKWEMAGRARQGGAPTADINPYASREPLVGGLARVYLDSSWASLGTTQLSGVVRSGTLEVTTGLVPVQTVDGRADLDFTKHSSGELEASLELVLELDATGSAQYQRYRDNGTAFIRVRFEGTPIGGQPRYVQFDGFWQVDGQPKSSVDGQQELVGIKFRLVRDTVSGNALVVTVRNGLQAV